MVVIPILVCILVFASSCTSTGGNLSSQASSTSPTSAQPATTVERVATPEQLASIIAAHEEEIRSLARSTRDCMYETGPCGSLASLQVNTLVPKLQTLATALDAANDNRPENGLYLGAYPQEVDRLTRETLEAAQGAAKVLETFVSDHCPYIDQCTGPGPLGSVTLGFLIDKFDAWRPWL